MKGAPLQVQPVWNQDWPTDELESVTACPVCGSLGRRVEHANLHDLAFEVAPGRWTLWRCDKCSSAYLDPRPDADHIGAAYGSYYTHESADIVEMPQRGGLIGLLRRGALNDFLNVRFGSRFQPVLPLGRTLFALMPGQRLLYEYSRRYVPKLAASGARLLDFGCGNGAFLGLASRIGWSVEGIDPDPQAVEAARRSGLVAHCGGLEKLEGRKDEFDSVTLNHVIEHVHDPVALLIACHRVLRKGGTLYIETPNIDSAGHAAFGAAWRGLEPPRHLILFSRSGLIELLNRVGFESIEELPATDAYSWMSDESCQLAARAHPPIPYRFDPSVTPHSGLDRREFITLTAKKTS